MTVLPLVVQTRSRRLDSDPNASGATTAAPNRAAPADDAATQTTEATPDPVAPASATAGNEATSDTVAPASAIAGNTGGSDPVDSRPTDRARPEDNPSGEAVEGLTDDNVVADDPTSPGVPSLAAALSPPTTTTTPQVETQQRRRPWSHSDSDSDDDDTTNVTAPTAQQRTQTPVNRGDLRAVTQPSGPSANTRPPATQTDESSTTPSAATRTGEYAAGTTPARSIVRDFSNRVLRVAQEQFQRLASPETTARSSLGPSGPPLMTAPTDSFGTPMSHQSIEEDPSESELTPLLGNATQPNVNSQSENAGDCQIGSMRSTAARATLHPKVPNVNLYRVPLIRHRRSHRFISPATQQLHEIPCISFVCS